MFRTDIKNKNRETLCVWTVGNKTIIVRHDTPALFAKTAVDTIKYGRAKHRKPYKKPHKAQVIV